MLAASGKYRLLMAHRGIPKHSYRELNHTQDTDYLQHTPLRLVELV
jgi:hypothetical protein